ncbi:hypothetical protein BJY01DRAFT_138957 [Aspergillus pseudoustus]|uniref:DUF6536 domain-containing protein n=1 Tax=Aspergillus pseudoustus TaxID=1810923 RepID=A0ABR4KCD0_9EURO
MDKLRVFELASLRRNHKPLKQDDVDKAEVPSQKERLGGRLGGWKGTLFLGSITSAIVLILNLVMVLWATLRHPDNRSVLYSGNCGRVKEIGAGIHFLINILSTLLLSASNYAMQCLGAPAREDLDPAHAKGKWLDIGVPSLKNLFKIPKTRSLLWVCLVFSSVPLHIFYNSTVYSTISANSYDVYVANFSFMSLPSTNNISVYDEYTDIIWQIPSAQQLVDQVSKLERLTPQECITAYATSFQSKYGSVVLISDDFAGTNASIDRVDSQTVPTSEDQIEVDPYRWICAERRGATLDHPCSYYISDLQSRDEWIVQGHKVDYCLADNEGEKCTLEFSLPLAIVVIVANFFKAVLIMLALILLNNAPLLTIGDAIASFLRTPDEVTEGESLLSREMVRSRWKQRKLLRFYSSIGKAATFCTFKLRLVNIPVPHNLELGSYSPRPLKDSEDTTAYSADPKRRWSSLSTTRWVICLFTYASSIAICIGLLIHGVTRMESQDGVWTSGLASINTKTMVNTLNWPGGLIPNTLIANIPQLIFSLLYFMCNTILTNMALAAEWDRFAVTRKGLRVSTPPQGQQRRTHFLSLPYRYGVPLITLSALLHWLMSQSIFLVRIVGYRNGERDTGGDTMTVGYSPPAIVIGLCVGVLLPGGLILTGSRRFRSGIPVAGSCSLAIAAACHPRRKGKTKIQYELLKWGAKPSEAGEIGHCAFSDGDVGVPVDGVRYR